MLPTTLSLRGHVAWDKFTLYIIYAKCVDNSDIGTKFTDPYGRYRNNAIDALIFLTNTAHCDLLNRDLKFDPM